jgi:hypothetical protein
MKVVLFEIGKDAEWVRCKYTSVPLTIAEMEALKTQIADMIGWKMGMIPR